MLVLAFCLVIYVIKMLDNEAIDIAVAVINVMSCVYISGEIAKPRKSDKIIVATAISVDLTNYESSCTILI